MKKTLIFAIVALLFCLFSSNVLAKDQEFLKPSDARFSSPQAYCDWLFKGNWAHAHSVDAARTCGDRPHKGTSLFRLIVETVKFTKPQYELNAILAGIENPKALKEDLEWLWKKYPEDRDIRLAIASWSGLDWIRKYFATIQPGELPLFRDHLEEGQIVFFKKELDILKTRLVQIGRSQWIPVLTYLSAQANPYMFSKEMCEEALGYSWGEYHRPPKKLIPVCYKHGVDLRDKSNPFSF